MDWLIGQTIEFYQARLSFHFLLWQPKNMTWTRRFSCWFRSRRKRQKQLFSITATFAAGRLTLSRVFNTIGPFFKRPKPLTFNIISFCATRKITKRFGYCSSLLLDVRWRLWHVPVIFKDEFHSGAIKVKLNFSFERLTNCDDRTIWVASSSHYGCKHPKSLQLFCKRALSPHWQTAHYTLLH